MNIAYILSIVIFGLLVILLGYSVYALHWNIRNKPEEPMGRVCINQDFMTDKDMRRLVRDYIKRENKAIKMAKRRH